jgi:hypothetical protein
VPLNYRLSDEEAAYVTDHSDAASCTSTPSTRRCSSGSGRHPEGRDILVYDGPAPAGMSRATS